MPGGYVYNFGQFSHKKRGNTLCMRPISYIGKLRTIEIKRTGQDPGRYDNRTIF